MKILIAFAVFALVARPLVAQERPNIVFLLADDHAAHAISAYRTHLEYGGDLPPTPHLDRLAAQGMLFTHAFASNSICGPSRAAILTGQYGHLTGVMTNREVLHPGTITFPALLRDAGYRTALFGKWHLKTAPEGFDTYEVLQGQGPYYNPRMISATDTTAYEGYTLDISTDHALAWMAEHAAADKPLMLMLAFNAPHRFWDPGPQQLALYRDTLFAEPPTFWDDASGRASAAQDPELKIALDLFDRDLKLEAPDNLTGAQRAAWDAAYAAENARYLQLNLTGDALARWRYQRFIKDYMRVVAALDENVGRVLDFLDRSGMADNTIVVYTSDQGFFLGDHGWFDKRFMYEESLRMPLIVRWPGAVRAGTVNGRLVMNLDLAQTFLDVGGAEAPAAMQGRSLVPLLRGEAPADWRTSIYYQYFEYPGWHSVRRQYGVRTDRYKLIHYYEIGEWELFDLGRDPEELRSVFFNPEYADVVTQLQAELRRLRVQYAVPETDPVPYLPSDVPPEWRRPAQHH